MVKRIKWTPSLIKRAEKIIREEITSQGRSGYLNRASARLFITYSQLDNAIRRGVLKTPPVVVVVKEPKASPPPPLEADHPDIRRLERRVMTLQDSTRDLRKKLTHADRRGHIIEALTATAEEYITPIERMNWPKLKTRKSQEDVDAFVTLSDQHADRVIREAGVWGLERYDFNVFRARLWEWAKVIKAYTMVHLPNYRFNTLWVGHLGDAVNGDIHNMKLKNQWGNSLKAALAVGDAQAEALLYLSEAFERIAVVCVSGNHGRTTNQIEWEDPHDNFDYLVAEAMRLRLADNPRVQIFAPRAWSAHVEVRGHLCHLNHGHGVKGSMGIPWYGFERREGRVQRLLSFKDRQAEYFFYGHFHTPMTRPAGKGKAIHAGAWYFTDEFCQNALAVGNKPEQQLLMMSERFGRQMEIPLMVRDKVREDKMFAGEWNPPFGRSFAVSEPDAHGDDLPIIR